MDETGQRFAKEPFEESAVLRADLSVALTEFSGEEKELLLLKYANGERDAGICTLYGMSRFALYRMLNRLKARLRKNLQDYDNTDRRMRSDKS